MIRFKKGVFHMITYTKVGDFLYPDLVLPNQDVQLTRYGLKKLNFLKEFRPGK